MVTGTLAKVGVEAVVEGFPEFAKNFGKMNDLMGSFTKGTETATRKMSPFNKILSAVGESLRRIGEFVIAGLIVKGIQRITEALGNMARAVFDAAAEFQGLIIRLEGLIALDIFKEGNVETFGDALAAAVDPASDLFFWIQQLALQTPFDIKDVANTITLAKAYGLTTDAAKITTTAILDFASGMGLTDIQMRRIIENFGQMIQQGKVTGTELRDLGRGAFFPVNDVLEKMRENLGLTTEEFIDLRKEGLTDVNAFMNAFIEIVGERFPNAGQRASRTITAVLGNIKDLTQGVLSFNVVRPVLDVISDKMADFLDILTTGARGDRLLDITAQIGENLAGIVDVIVGGFPSAESAADGLLGILDRVKGVIIGIREILESDTGVTQKAAGILGLLGFDPGIASKVEGIFLKIKGVFDLFKAGDITGGLGELGVPQPIVDFVEGIIKIFDRLGAWWDTNGERVKAALIEIGTGLGLSAQEAGEGALDIVLSLLESFADFLEENGDVIIKALESVGKTLKEDFAPAIEKLGDFVEEHGEDIVEFLFGFAAGIKAIGLVIGTILVIAGILAILSSPILVLIGLIPVLIGLLFAFGRDTWTALQQLAFIIAFWLNEAQNKFIVWRHQLGQKLAEIVNVATVSGKNIVIGLWNGMIVIWNNFVNFWGRTFSDWWQSIKNFFGVGSPSKLFEGLGTDIMEGFSKGIADAVQLPQDAMNLAVTHTLLPVTAAVQASPAMGGAVTNNFTLNQTTQAKSSTLIADFRMMESIVGA